MGRLIFRWWLPVGASSDKSNVLLPVPCKLFLLRDGGLSTLAFRFVLCAIRCTGHLCAYPLDYPLFEASSPVDGGFHFSRLFTQPHFCDTSVFRFTSQFKPHLLASIRPRRNENRMSKLVMGYTLGSSRLRHRRRRFSALIRSTSFNTSPSVRVLVEVLRRISLSARKQIRSPLMSAAVKSSGRSVPLLCAARKK